MSQNQVRRRHMYHSLQVVGIVLLVIALASACREGPRIVRNPAANVVLITLDTTRADRLGCYGYTRAQTPNLDRLAAGGMRFEHAVTPVPLTLPAHASIMSGSYPPFHRARNNGNYFLPSQALTLAEIFKTRGYATAAFVASFILDSRFGLDQGFDLYDDRLGDPAVVKGVYSERGADEVFRSFETWFAHRGQGKFFAWVHFFDPHMPYNPPEPFKSAPGLDPYDGELANVDVHIGKILELLGQEPTIRENTLVAVAGDHGEAFGEHGEFGHGVFCYQESLAVPLILWAPGLLPSQLVVSDRVGLVDLFPTLLDFCEAKVPPQVQGISLLRLVEENRTLSRPLYFESYFPFENLGCAPLKGEIGESFKYIDLPRPELYNLERDPNETRNLILDDTGTAREMRQRLATLENELGRATVDSVRTVTPEERRRLESLGYLSLGKRPAEKGPLPDPKDRIAGWTAFNRGLALRQAGRRSDAEAALREAAAQAPDLTGPVIELGEIYFAERNVPSLMSLFEEAIRNHPQSGELRIRFAYYLVLLGKTAAAVDELQAAEPVVAFGQREQLYDTLGMAHGAAGDFAGAVDAYSKVLEIEPDNADAARKLGYALFRLGRKEEALAAFRQAEALAPDNPLLLEEMGRFYAAQKDHDRAALYFQKAVDRPDPPALALFNYAVLLSERGDFARAIEMMERYLAISGQDRRSTERPRQLIAVWRRR